MSMSPIMAGLGVAGGVMDAYGQYQQGKQQQAAYNYNAEVSQQQAGMARARASLNEFQKTKQANIQVGRQRAAYAKGGVSINTGSPIDTLIDSLGNANLDIAIDNYNFEVQARGYESEANMQRYYGAQAKSAGKAAAFGSLLKTAGSFGANFIGSGTKPYSGGQQKYYPGYKHPGASQPGFAGTGSY